MSLHSLPPPEFAQQAKPARRHNPSAGQQADSNEAYSATVLRVLRQTRHHLHPSPPSSDDE